MCVLQLPGLCVNHQEVPMQLSRQVVHISPLEGTSCVFGGHGGYLRIKLEITMFWCSLVSCLDDRPLLKPSKFKLSWSNFPLQCRPTVTSICFPSGTSWQGKRRQDKKKPYTDLLMFRAWSNSKRSIHHTKSWQSVVFVWKPSNFLSIIAQNKSLWEPAIAILSL